MLLQASVISLLSGFLFIGIHGNQDLRCTLKENNISASAKFTNLTFAELTEPAFPSGHPPANCTWRISAEPLRRVKLVILTLKLSDPKDHVIIYDGPSTTSPILAGYGPCAKGGLTLYSSGSNVLVVLVSHSNAATGKLMILFKALPEDYIACTSDQLLDSPDYCSGSVKYATISSGHMTSPSFPNPSPRTRCMWSLTAPPGHRIQISFHWMGLHCYDPIVFSDLAAAKTTTEYCGCDTLPVIVSADRELWIKFLSTQRFWGPGFWFTYRTISLQECPMNRTDCPTSYTPQGFDRAGTICTDTDLNPTTLPLSTTTSTTTSSPKTTTPNKTTTPDDITTAATITTAVTKQDADITNVPTTMLKVTTDATRVTTLMTNATTVTASNTASKTTDKIGSGSTDVPTNNPPTVTTQGIRDMTKGTTLKPETTSASSTTQLSTAFTTKPTVEKRTNVFTSTRSRQSTATASTFKTTAAYSTQGSKSKGQGTTSPQTTTLPSTGLSESTKASPTQVMTTILASKQTPTTKRRIGDNGAHGGKHLTQGRASTTRAVGGLRGTVLTVTGRPEDVGSGEDGTDTADVQKQEGGGDPPGSVGVKTKGVKVKCNKDHMEVVLYMERFEGLSIQSLRLSDRSCKPRFSNETHVFFRVPLSGCGTAHNSTEDSITYYNTIIGESVDVEHKLITRKYHARFGFDCSYAKRRTLSVVSFSPRRKVAYALTDGRGNFTYLMDLYKTNKYQDHYDEYPVTITVGQRIYAQVLVKADKSLVIFLDTCSATPTSNYYDPRNYEVIQNGCSRDQTLQYDYKLSAVQQFSLTAFHFTNITSSTPVYLHCLVHVCPRSDNGSVCALGCVESGRRKRRALKEHAQDEALEVLTLGPISISDRQSDHALSRSPAVNSVLIVAICVALLGMVTFGLIAAVAMVIIRRRRPRPQTSYNMVYISVKKPND